MKGSCFINFETGDTGVTVDEEDCQRFYRVSKDYYGVYKIVGGLIVEAKTDRYIYNRSEFYVDPVLTWIIRGIHGIPLEI